MKKWVGYIAQQAGESYIWNTGHHYGDWLAFNTTRSDYPGATTDKDLIATAYFAHSTSLLAKAAAVLGKEGDVDKYQELLARIKSAFQKEFVTPNGRLSSNTQTAYSLALAFDLLPETIREKAAQRLAEDVNQFGHITTGFLGTPLICHVLSRYGYFDEAFMLLNRKEYPSWLYPITMGATTIWERWDGIKPDSTFQNKGMNSFNHYAYGAIGEWLYRVVAGLEIDPEHPGYKHIVIQPHPGGGLEGARASVVSPYGRVTSGWQLTDDKITMSVEIPPNTTATINLPSARAEGVLETGKGLSKAKGITKWTQEGDVLVVEAGSGEYEFVYSME
jgi:alpha-L-rhamnosidase